MSGTLALMAGSVRVVGGTARGRRLRVPPGGASRPTRGLVREAVFDMVGSAGGLVEARVADLFAGSGAMGIEALSRGAAAATFVDADARAAATVRANLAVLGPLACRAEVVCADVSAWLGRRQAAVGGSVVGGPVVGCPVVGGSVVGGPVVGGSVVGGSVADFDLVLCDPPYAFGRWDDLFAQLWARCAPEALVVVESGQRIEPPVGWVSVRSRSYGSSVVSIVRSPHRQSPQLSKKGPD